MRASCFSSVLLLLAPAALCHAQLETGTVDDELAALKKGMLTAGSNGAPVAALPEGRPVKDAIDMELEQLRKKAAE
jgi:phage shock protein A